jgi:hypothetical protein
MKGAFQLAKFRMAIFSPAKFTLGADVPALRLKIASGSQLAEG